MVDAGTTAVDIGEGDCFAERVAYLSVANSVMVALNCCWQLPAYPRFDARGAW
jgi:hypothetical protein